MIGYMTALDLNTYWDSCCLYWPKSSLGRVATPLSMARAVSALTQATFLVRQALEGRGVGVLFQQGQGDAIVDTGGNEHAGLQGRALGLVLQARIVHCAGTGADEIEPRLFQCGHHVLVFRHESVAGKNGVVIVVVR